MNEPNSASASFLQTEPRVNSSRVFLFRRAHISMHVYFYLRRCVTFFLAEDLSQWSQKARHTLLLPENMYKYTLTEDFGN